MMMLIASLILATVTNLNLDWRFSKAPEGSEFPKSVAEKAMEQAGRPFYAVDYDDSNWELVSVPHAIDAHDSYDDRAVDGGEINRYRGFLFYRKHFSATAKGKTFVAFETVRQTIYLYCNGRFVGYYEAGIAPSGYDLTDFVKAGDNVLAVATDTTAGRLSKIFVHETIPGHEPGDNSGTTWQWASQSFNEVQGGLIGDVKLYEKPKTYLTLPLYNNLKTQGSVITAKDFVFDTRAAGDVGPYQGAAVIKAKVEVRNEGAGSKEQGASVDVRVSVVEPVSGKVVGVLEKKGVTVPVAKDAGKRFVTALEDDVYEANPAPTALREVETTFVTLEGRMEGLKFWSPDVPWLYDVKVELCGTGGAEATAPFADTATIRTGFREVKFDPATRLLTINGKPFYGKGYAQRSTDSWAAIGYAVPWLQDYDAKLMRESNGNFIRWMHTAPKPAPIRALDKLGVVCVCPFGDGEQDAKGRQWGQRMEAAMATMIYFRNSPSCVFWEAGNNQVTPAHMEEMRHLKDLLDAGGHGLIGCRTISSPEQVKWAEWVGTMIHRHDDPAFESMEKLGCYAPMIETEFFRDESPRRVWDDFTPPDYDYVCRWLGGGAKESRFDVYDETQEDFARKSLGVGDGYTYFFGNRLNGQGKRYYAGAAMLCWADSNQHGRQSFAENARMSGRVDPVRIPKEHFYVMQTAQSETPRVKILGHWSYPDLTSETYRYRDRKWNGHNWEYTDKVLQRNPKEKTVYAIGSLHIAKMALYVNGVKKGECDKPKDLFVFSFPKIDVTEHGRAEVVGYDRDGREIARDTVETVGPAAKLEMTVMTSPAGFCADGSDIAMVDLRLVDAQGRVLPYANNRVEFEMTFEGGAEAAAPTFMGGYNSGTYDETSPIGKNWVNLECGVNRVFLKAGRETGKVVLTAKIANIAGVRGGAPATATVEIPVVKAGEWAASWAPNDYDFTVQAVPYVRDYTKEMAEAAQEYMVRVNKKQIKFHKRAPAFRPDASSGVVCAFRPVLEAIRDAGSPIEVTQYDSGAELPERLKGKNTPVIVVKTPEHTIDIINGETNLILDEGREQNLTNYEIAYVRGNLVGELNAILGYLPKVKMEMKSASAEGSGAASPKKAKKNLPRLEIKVK